MKLNKKELETIQNILLINKEKRNENQINELKFLLGKYEYFSVLEKIGKAKLNLLYQNLTLKRVKNDFILFYGQKPNKFYFLLDGKLEILEPKDLNAFTLTKKEDYNIISIVESGKPIGEMALLAQKERGASVYSVKESLIISLNKKLYLKCIKNKDKMKIDLKIEKIKKYLFYDLDKISIMKISYFFKKRRYQMNSLIFEEDNIINKMFLLIQGEIMLLKRIRIPFFNPDKIINKNQILKKEILTIKNNKLFGIWEYFNNKNNFFYSGKVISNSAIIYEIDKEKILHLINNKRFEEYFVAQSEKFHRIEDLNKKNIQIFVNSNTKANLVHKNLFNQNKRFLTKMNKKILGEGIIIENNHQGGDTEKSLKILNESHDNKILKRTFSLAPKKLIRRKSLNSIILMNRNEETTPNNKLYLPKSINLFNKKVIKNNDKIESERISQKLDDTNKENLIKTNTLNKKINFNHRIKGFIEKITYYKSLKKKFENRVCLKKNSKIHEKFKSQRDVNFLSLNRDNNSQEKLLEFKKRKSVSTNKNFFQQNLFLKKTIRNLKTTKEVGFKNVLKTKNITDTFRISIKKLFIKKINSQIRQRFNES